MTLLRPATSRHATVTAFGLTVAIQLTFTGLLRLFVVPVLVPGSHVHSGLQRAGDSLFFHELASKVAGGLRAVGVRALWDEQFPGLLHTKVLGVLYYLAGGDWPYFVYAVYALIAGASAALLVRAALLLGCQPAAALWAALPVPLSPLVLFSHSELLREPFAVLFGALLVVGWLATASPGGLPRRAAGVVVLTAAFGGLAAIRPYLMLPVLAATAVAIAALAAGWLMASASRRMLRDAVTWLGAATVVMYVTVVMPGWADAFQYDDRSASADVANTVHAAAAARVDSLRAKTAEPSAAALIEREDVLVPSVCTVPWRRLPWVPAALDSKLEAIACSRQDFLRYCDQGLLGVRADRNCDQFLPTSAPALLQHLPAATIWGLATPFPNMWFDGFGSGGTGLRRAGYVVDGVMTYLLLPGVVLLILRLPKEPLPAAVALALIAVTTLYALAVPSQFILARMRMALHVPLLCLGLVGWLTWLRRRNPAAAPLS